MRIFSITILFILSFSILYGQTQDEIIEYFNEGKYFFARKDYQEAAYYFSKLLIKYPDNAHFNFMMGECYLNIPGSEVLAIPYFEKSIIRTVAKKKYRGKDFYETNAPLHAYFYLGNAYRISNRLDDALKAYYTFINSPFYFGNYNLNVVENEIKSCERAKIIQDNPLVYTEQALDTLINTTAEELHPVVSANEKYIVFIRKLKFYDAIFLSVKNVDRWSKPVNLNPFVGSDGDMIPTCLSADGTELYLVKENNGSSDLYVSYYRDSTWTIAEKLSNKINSRADETSACISSDGQKLFFVSSRKKGLGGKDIYISQKNSNNQWGKARNLGDEINTIFDEESPCLTNSDKTLYFSSKGHYSMGGFDIFYSTYTGKNWSEPVNIGFPVNNTSDNIGYISLAGGRIGYLSKLNHTDHLESEDIFRLILKSNLPLH
jgi:tetratricopeptide (TPR) repeat protein